ncbi:MAG: DNA-directed RNA polymerase subunit omega [Christensenellaceae bacterium]|jgi:DNA-directed RNA polymerase omega subunit|nr:DNA-directed RNA polymerase subunit omega [Christensenellaceae bacterium]
MMIQPPIDELIKKAPCRYALVTGVAKRALEITEAQLSNNSEEGTEGKDKAISQACKEIYSDEFIIKI